MSGDDITRDGFRYAQGQFYAHNDVERIDGSRLKDLFLPRLTPEASKLLRDHPNFVRGQLQHYGVRVKESEFSGSGTVFFKKTLQAGKCDKVPARIEKLQAQMRSEWLEQQSEEQLSNTVKPATNNRASKKAQAYQSEDEDDDDDDPREAERAAKHEKYLADTKKPRFGPRGPSVIGQYMIDCEEIEGNWSDLAGDMTLAIGITTQPGIYLANFHFGIIEGVMLLSAVEDDLDAYCAQLDRQQRRNEDYYGELSESDADEDDDDDEEEPAIAASGSKRKAASTTKRGRPAKKAKAASIPKNFFLRMKHRDTGTGEIHYTAEEGTIKFGPANLSAFTGKVDMAGIGQGVVFTARKISGMPPTLGDTWENYSESAYENARRRRW